MVAQDLGGTGTQQSNEFRLFSNHRGCPGTLTYTLWTERGFPFIIPLAWWLLMRRPVWPQRTGVRKTLSRLFGTHRFLLDSSATMTECCILLTRLSHQVAFA